MSNPQATFRDSWANAFSGIGDLSVDRRLATHPTRNPPLQPEELRSLYEGDALAYRVISAFPRAALARGFSFSCESDPELADLLNAKMVTPDFEKSAELALEIDRAFGGCLFWPAYELDSTDLRNPPPIGKPIAAWFPIEPRDTGIAKVTPYGKALVYFVSVGTMCHNLHFSRVVRMDGITTSPRTRQILRGWGLSVLQRPYEILRDAGMTFAALSILIEEVSQVVWQMAGLKEAIALNQQGLILERMKQAERQRSVRRPVIIDSADNFGRVETSLAGVADTIDRVMQLVSMASGIPVAILMGRSPAGLNATGESDSRAFYDEVENYRRLVVAPMLVDAAAFQLLSWSRTAPDDLKVTFPSLWNPTEVEAADIYQKRAAASVALVNAGIVDAFEIRQEEIKRGTFAPSLSDDEARSLAEIARGNVAETDPLGGPIVA